MDFLNFGPGGAAAELQPPPPAPGAPLHYIQRINSIIMLFINLLKPSGKFTYHQV
jgi:hypothetical protein